MQRLPNSARPTDLPSGSVATWGVFDGVHLGHRDLLVRLMSLARDMNAPATVLLFDQSPDELLVAAGRQHLLTTIEGRCRILSELGVDNVVHIEVDESFARQHLWEFVDQYLIDLCGATTTVVGTGVEFGTHGGRTLPGLTEYTAKRGLRLETVSTRHIDKEPVTCDHIRSTIRRGQVDRASSFIGRPPRVEGVVVHGEARGRELGYPTANIDWAAQTTLPADGVYAGWLVVDPYDTVGQTFPAAISVGTNPTFTGHDRTVEVHVLGRDDLDLYDVHVAVDFELKLRDQIPYRGQTAIADLVAQIALDVEEASRVLQARGIRDLNPRHSIPSEVVS